MIDLSVVIFKIMLHKIIQIRPNYHLLFSHCYARDGPTHSDLYLYKQGVQHSPSMFI